MSSSFPVKWFDRVRMKGAPVLSGTPGALIGLLDACLIDGFGAVTPSSVSVSNNVATATVNSGDAFVPHAVILVSGADDPKINGECRVLSATDTTFTFATDAADGAATGTISIRYAPVGGWQKLFSGANKAVYQSTDALASGFCVRVDDAGTTSARIVGYESMSDIDTGANPFPTASQYSGGLYLWKSANANTTGVDWYLFADSMKWMLANTMYPRTTFANASYTALRGFGDDVPFGAGDAYAVTLSASGSDSRVFNGAGFARISSGGQPNDGQMYAARGYAANPGAVGASAEPYISAGNTVFSSQDGKFGGVMGAPHGHIRMSKHYLAGEGDRALIPGAVYFPYNSPNGLLRNEIYDGDDDLLGRKVLIIGSDYYTSTIATRFYGVDITGPWR